MPVFVTKMSEAPSLAPDPAAALVVLADPSDAADPRSCAASWGPAACGGWAARLDLAFWDQDFLPLPQAILVRAAGSRRNLCLSVGGRLWGEEGIPWRPFLQADAADLRRFAEGLRASKISSVHVVCRNGRGRSRAIAGWLSETLGVALADKKADDPKGSVWVAERLKAA